MSSKMKSHEIERAVKDIVKTQLHEVMSILDYLTRSSMVQFINSLNDHDSTIYTIDGQYHYKHDHRIYISNPMMSVLKPADKEEFPLFYETVFNTFADRQYELHDGYLLPNDEIRFINGAKPPTEEKLQKLSDKFLVPGIELFVKMMDTLMAEHSNRVTAVYSNLNTAIRYGHTIKTITSPQTFNYGIKIMNDYLPFISMSNYQFFSPGWVSKYSRTKLCDNTGITISTFTDEVLIVRKDKLPHKVLPCKIKTLPCKTSKPKVKADFSSDEDVPDLPYRPL